MRIQVLSKEDYPAEWTAGGQCYKNEEVYFEDRDAICYIPEVGYDEKDNDCIDRDLAYSHHDLLELCKGDEKMCDGLFSILDWGCPEISYIEMDFEEDDNC